MTRGIYVRVLGDKYRGPSFHLSVTADSGGAVPGQVINDREDLMRVFRSAALERLMAGVDDAQARGEVFCSGPLEISLELDAVLLRRSAASKLIPLFPSDLPAP